MSLMNSTALSRRGVLLGMSAFAVAGCSPGPDQQSSAQPVDPGPVEPAPVEPAEEVVEVAPDPEPAPPEPEPELQALSAEATDFPVIIDTANRLTPELARSLADVGVRAVFRYYGHEPATIRGKHLEPAERDILFDAGMTVAVVFQHWNNCFLTFQNGWGREDAEAALRQAELNDQPEGTAIYFGVDGDWPYAALIDDVRRYMDDVRAAFAGSGYRIGAYGSGCALDRVAQDGPLDFRWLSGATAFTGTKAYYNRGDWTLYQNMFDFQAGAGRQVGVDTNLLNPAAGGDFGQWGPSGAGAGGFSAEQSRVLLSGRRFTTRRVEVLSEPRPGASALTALRVDSNLIALSEGDGWTRVRTQEGGDARRGPSVEGFVQTASLTSMERFAGDASFGLCGVDRAAPSSLVEANCSRASFRER